MQPITPMQRGRITAMLVGSETDRMSAFFTHVIDKAGINVWTVRTYTEAVISLGRRVPDVVVVCVGDSEACQSFLGQVREITDRPTIVIGTRRGDMDVAQILMAGADDFVSMPLGPLELRARIDVALRRRRNIPQEGLLSVGDLLVDLNMATALLNGTSVRVSPEELRLLAILARHAGKVVDHDMLINAVWGGASLASAESLRTLVRRLRTRLRQLGPKYEPPIVSVRGFGYYLSESASVDDVHGNEGSED